VSDESNKGLINYRIQRAQEHLKSAEILSNAGQYSDSIGRSYYAMIAAAKSLLALKDIDSKKHDGEISLFNKLFVKTGLIDRAAAKDLTKARVRRESSDYADFYIVSREDALMQLEMARSFIRTVEIKIEQLMKEK